jgi:hypothetical protein
MTTFCAIMTEKLSPNLTHPPIADIAGSVAFSGLISASADRRETGSRFQQVRNERIARRYVVAG